MMYVPGSASAEKSAVQAGFPASLLWVRFQTPCSRSLSARQRNAWSPTGGEPQWHECTHHAIGLPYSRESTIVARLGWVGW